MPITVTNFYTIIENPVGSGNFEIDTVQSTSTVELSDGGGNDILELGEDVILTDTTPVTAGTFAGSVGADGVVFVSGSDLILTTTSTTFNVGDPVAVTTSNFAICFGAGTMIATPDGEKSVETLQIGDMVTTAEGRAVPVKWVGRQTLVKMFAGHVARPVRVAAGALGNGLPHSDLVLTADHALIIDGMAINAGALVNRTSITVDPLSSLPDRVTYYHLETEGHDVILANGAAAETFVDYVTRSKFDNYAEYVDLYGEERAIDEMPHVRISTSRLVPAEIKARLAVDKVA